MDKAYDLIIIGGSPAGYTGAIRAAQLGLNTALVEKESTLGGTCSNIGCIPSKALLDSSEFYANANHKAAEHGVITGSVKLNLDAMMARKQGIVDRLTGGIAQLIKSNKIELYNGTGSLAGSGQVKVAGPDGKTTLLKGDKILLATGSVVQDLPFLPLDGKVVISSTEALSLKKVPKSMVVVGAGAIGLEMGSVWSRLGTDVTVVEILPQIMAGGDKQLASGLQRELKKQGFRFKLETRVVAAKALKTKAVLELETKDGGKESIEAEKILVSVGRKPFMDGLGLEEAGVKLTENGRFIEVDGNFQTSLPGVYAVGDIVPGPMLAHKAEEEAVAAVERMAGVAGHVNYNLIPGVIYTWPEAASTGKTEEQLKEEGIAFNKGVFNFNANGRAVAMGDTAGFV